MPPSARASSPAEEELPVPSVHVVGVEQCQRLLDRAYGSLTMRRLGTRPMSLRHESTQLGPLRLDRLTFRGRQEVEVHAHAPVSVSILRGGRIRGIAPDGGFVEHGEVFLIDPARLGAPIEMEDADLEFVVLRAHLLAEAVARLEALPPEQQVHFTQARARSVRAGEQWKSTFAFLLAQARTNPSLSGQPLVADAAARLLIATTLATFPNSAVNTPDEQGAADHRLEHPLTLRQAISFIEGNAHREISAADIAAACNVTVRAVQLAFQGHLGTTPLAFLRRVRLQQAHDQLARATPDEATVTAVAGRWGFSNPSRFAAQYRETFGELPSQTLRR